MKFRNLFQTNFFWRIYFFWKSCDFPLKRRRWHSLAALLTGVQRRPQFLSEEWASIRNERKLISKARFAGTSFGCWSVSDTAFDSVAFSRIESDSADRMPGYDKTLLSGSCITGKVIVPWMVSLFVRDSKEVVHYSSIGKHHRLSSSTRLVWSSHYEGRPSFILRS